MLALIRRHLIAKITIIVVTAVALGFGVSIFLSTRTQIKTLEKFHRVSAAALSHSIGASVKHSMLAGNGVEVRQLIRKIKSKTEHATIRIYAPNGKDRKH